MYIPSIESAMAEVARLDAYYKQRRLDAPSEEQVMQLLDAARARDAQLSPAQWESAWKLGAHDLTDVCCRLRNNTGRDISDAAFAVVNLFHPEQSYNPERNQRL